MLRIVLPLAVLLTFPASGQPRVAGAELVTPDAAPSELEPLLIEVELTSAEVDLLLEAAPKVVAWGLANAEAWKAADLGSAATGESFAALRALGAWKAAGLSFEEFVAVKAKVDVGLRLLASPFRRLKDLDEVAAKLDSAEDRLEAAGDEVPPEQVARARADLERFRALLPLARAYPPAGASVLNRRGREVQAALHLLRRLPSADAGEEARRLPSRVDVASWHEGGTVHAAIANVGAKDVTALVGLKQHDCGNHDDASWAEAFVPLTLPARSVVVYSLEAPADGTFLVFHGEVDEEFNEHYGGVEYEHLLASSWVLSQRKVLDRHMVERGAAVTLPWSASAEVTVCEIDVRAQPWLSVAGAEGVVVVNDLDAPGRERLVAQVTEALGSIPRGLDRKLNPADGSLIVVCLGPQELQLRVDTSKVSASGRIGVRLRDVTRYSGRGVGSGGDGVAELLVYDADMKVIEGGPGD